jgi:hypothetical protein
MAICHLHDVRLLLSRDQRVGFRQRSSTPLKRKRGWPAGSPLKSTSSVQVTQKSFSTFCSGVPSRVAAPRNTSRRSRGAALRNSEKPEFITTAASLSDHTRLVSRYWLIQRSSCGRWHSTGPHPEEVRSPGRASTLVVHRDRSEDRRESPLRVLGRPEFLLIRLRIESPRWKNIVEPVKCLDDPHRRPARPI